MMAAARELAAALRVLTAFCADLLGIFSSLILIASR
ncbi:hypothetical protein RLEG3_06395 (plasmid) [Rhizobium leguminosarum bv. trifolii WSM1689]|nr:hypothetical protein RLEG3_06395 [Rhizobium leguminosarum bv. trifolii WSM1689]